jgi:hypothetical protein
MQFWRTKELNESQSRQFPVIPSKQLSDQSQFRLSDIFQTYSDIRLTAGATSFRIRSIASTQAVS